VAAFIKKAVVEHLVFNDFKFVGKAVGNGFYLKAERLRDRFVPLESEQQQGVRAQRRWPSMMMAACDGTLSGLGSDMRED